MIPTYTYAVSPALCPCHISASFARGAKEEEAAVAVGWAGTVARRVREVVEKVEAWVTRMKR